MKYTAEFNNIKELETFYCLFSNNMPGRAKDRSKIHRENVPFAKFAVLFSKCGWWDYPVRVEYSDKPDFRISSAKGTIGIEVTEQKSKNYGHALALSERCDGFIESSDFRYDPNEKRLNGKQLGELVSKKECNGPPSVGFMEENNWVLRSLDTAIGKVEQYKKYKQYEKYSQNVLLVFDVRPEFPQFTDITKAMLTPIFGNCEVVRLFQHLVFIDSKCVHIDLTSQKMRIVS